jgi:D-amino-acid oxidase
VSGLSTAVCLAESGDRVRVITRELPKDTTSCAAGAIWSPYLTEDERVVPWARQARPVLEEIADQGDTGVRRVRGREAARDWVPIPDWAVDLDGFRGCTASELPDGFVTGWWYVAPVVDMPVYLAYLVDRFLAAGGRLELGTVASLREPLDEAPVVVNCTGIGARDLVPDPALTPTRGQLVVVDNPGVNEFFAEHDESPEPTYFLPHGNRVVLGGSAHLGRADRGADPDVSKAIIERCAAIEAALADPTVVEHRVGLRPTRARVRLEREDHHGRHVIHNYGHGGAGVTVSWGCAAEVRDLINAL